MRQPVIYADLLFFTNFTIDYMLLFAAGKAARSSIRRMRVLAASALGGIYAVLLFFPETAFLFHPLCKLLFSVGMICIAFRFAGWQKLAQQILYFYVISFCFAGAAEFANHYFPMMKIHNGIVYYESSIWILIVSCAAAYFLIPFLLKLTVGRYQKEKMIKEILLVRKDKSVILKGMVDTGNSLCDPVSGKPVMVAELSHLAPLFDETEIRCFQDAAEPNNRSVHRIPYHALGIHSTLKCFAPDRAVILGKKPKEVELLVGVREEKLSGNGEFQALLHPLVT